MGEVLSDEFVVYEGLTVYLGFLILETCAFIFLQSEIPNKQ